MLQPYAQIEILHSFQVEKRQELMKLREREVVATKPSWMAQVLYELGNKLIVVGTMLQQRVELQFNG